MSLIVESCEHWVLKTRRAHAEQAADGFLCVETYFDYGETEIRSSGVGQL